MNLSDSAVNMNDSMNSTIARVVTPAPAEFNTSLITHGITVAVAAIGLILNLIIFITAIIRLKTRWKKQLILILNIILCDIVICIGSIMLSSGHITQVVMNEQFKSLYPNRPTAEQLGVFRRFSCVNKLGYRLFDVGTLANLFGLFLMTLDHLIAVRWSIQHATILRNQWVIISCAISWIPAFILGFVTSMLIPHITRADKWPAKGTTYYCYLNILSATRKDGSYKYELDQEHINSVGNWISVVTITLVFLFMLCVYSYIATVIISVNRRRKAQNSQYNETRRNLKGIGTTALLLGTFVLLDAPSYSVYFVRLFGDDSKISNVWLEIFAIILALTPIVDVCIYASRNKDISKLFRLQKSKKSRRRRQHLRDGTFDMTKSTQLISSTTTSH